MVQHKTFGAVFHLLTKVAPDTNVYEETMVSILMLHLNLDLN